MPRNGNDLETAWAAGLFEGEGCLTVSYKGQRYNPKMIIKLEMLDYDVVERFAAWAGVGQFKETHARPGYTNTYWLWETGRLEYILMLIERLYPYMGERRQAKMDEALSVAADWSIGHRCIERMTDNKAEAVRLIGAL